MSDANDFSRRDFVKTAGGAAAAATVVSAAPALASVTAQRRRYAIVGTGSRAIGMWGSDLVKKYGDVLEFAGLCDTNHKRVEIAKGMIGANCPTFTNFDEMVERTKPEVLMVTTVHSTHVDYITRALDRGIDVITEKPMVTDEKQVKAVLDAERRPARTREAAPSPGARTCRRPLKKISPASKRYSWRSP